MAREPLQTVGDLRRKTIVSDDEIMAAVEAYLADRKAKPYRFASGHVLDVGAAVAAHRPSQRRVERARHLKYLPPDHLAYRGDPGSAERGMSTQPDPLLDPTEAQIHIRTIVEATADLTYGTKAEPTIREIMRILDKALPPRRHGRPKQQ